MTEYGSEFDALANRSFTSDEKKGLGLEGAEYFRSGRDAMKSLALLTENRPKLILLPALCCESMIIPFTLNGYKVEFYRLNSDLTGDREDLIAKLRDGAMLLYMNYFGIRPFADEFLRELKARFERLILVEDRTHDIIIPRDNESFRPDAMLASVRKWAALPDGGVLVTALKRERCVADRRFCDIRQAAMEKKSRYLQSFHPDLKEEFLQELHIASDMLDESGIPCGIAADYLEKLEHLDYARILKKRRENVVRLMERLSPTAAAGRLSFLTEHPEDSTLYFPILLEERGRVQRKMAESAVYCPVIWPAPAETEGICPVSRHITEHMLAIPCDQRYSEDDMNFIADCLIRAL